MKWYMFSCFAHHGSASDKLGIHDGLACQGSLQDAIKATQTSHLTMQLPPGKLLVSPGHQQRPVWLQVCRFGVSCHGTCFDNVWGLLASWVNNGFCLGVTNIAFLKQALLFAPQSLWHLSAALTLGLPHTDPSQYCCQLFKPAPEAPGAPHRALTGTSSGGAT